MLESPNVLLLFPLVVLIGLTNTFTSDQSNTNNDFSCICNHCDASKVMAIEENDSEVNEATVEKNVYTEDFDGDGNLTICARDRDYEDRSFPSICHMLCYNECTRYRILIYKVKREKKYIASAFRTVLFIMAPIIIVISWIIDSNALQISTNCVMDLVR